MSVFRLSVEVKNNSFTTVNYFRKKKRFIFIWGVWVLLLYVYLYSMCLVSTEARRLCVISWSRSYRWPWAAIWLLGTEPRSSVRAESVLNFWLISLAPIICSYFFLILFAEWVFCLHSFNRYSPLEATSLKVVAAHSEMRLSLDWDSCWSQLLHNHGLG